MNVAELIELLRLHPQEALVHLRAREGKAQLVIVNDKGGK